jgi:hypothetical protein
MGDEPKRATTVNASQDFVDKLAIRELLERYMRYNDNLDGRRLAELFDDDAQFQVMGRVYADEALERLFDLISQGNPGATSWTEAGELLKQPGTIHFSSNPVIDVDGDSASAESDFLLMARDDKGHPYVRLVGRYRDRLRRREDGRWLISTRTAVALAKPGEEWTDSDWQRAFVGMPEDERQRFRM